MAYKQRLNKLEHGKHGEYLDIIQLVRQGVYYDELSEVQKRKYIAYKESLGGCATDVSFAELDMLMNDKTQEQAYHFQISKRKRPPTEEEHRQAVEEIEQFFNEKFEEYNNSK